MHNNTFRAVSDVYGKITSLAVIAIEGACVEVSVLKRQINYTLGGIFRAFPHVQCRILGFHNLPDSLSADGDYGDTDTDKQHPIALPNNVVLHPIPVQKMFRFGGTPRDTRPVAPPKYFRPTEWIQDSFAVLQKNGTTALLESLYYKFYNTENPAPYFVADILASLNGIVLKPFLYPFIGSNILTDGYSYAFINATTLPSSLSDTEQKEIEEAFRSALGVPLLFWIRNASRELGCGQVSPLYRSSLIRSIHLDMYITLGGKYMNALGASKELVFVARITPESMIIDQDVTPLQQQAICKRVADTNRSLDDIAAAIERYSHSSLSFEVVRIPLIIDFRHNERNIRSYNNCYVEVYDSTKNVYLPQYYEHNPLSNANLFTVVEEQAKSIFEQYGFTTIMVEGDFVEYSNRGGSLHCMTKVLSREVSML